MRVEDAKAGNAKTKLPLYLKYSWNGEGACIAPGSRFFVLETLLWSPGERVIRREKKSIKEKQTENSGI